jgi:hypothetical protein
LARVSSNHFSPVAAIEHEHVSTSEQGEKQEDIMESGRIVVTPIQNRHLFLVGEVNLCRKGVLPIARRDREFHVKRTQMLEGLQPFCIVLNAAEPISE